MRTNPLTEIREAIERLFVGRLEGLVQEVVCFNKSDVIVADDPSMQITRWLRVDPLGGPVDPFDTNARWKFTRGFRILFNNPAGDMDVEGMEKVELAVHGCLADGVNSNLGLSHISAVRWRGGEWATFVPQKKSGEDFSEGQEMWVSVGTLEVDFVKLRTEVATWAPQ